MKYHLTSIENIVSDILAQVKFTTVQQEALHKAQEEGTEETESQDSETPLAEALKRKKGKKKEVTEEMTSEDLFETDEDTETDEAQSTKGKKKARNVDSDQKGARQEGAKVFKALTIPPPHSFSAISF